jgi:hypothetical protein
MRDPQCPPLDRGWLLEQKKENGMVARQEIDALKKTLHFHVFTRPFLEHSQEHDKGTRTPLGVATHVFMA